LEKVVLDVFLGAGVEGAADGQLVVGDADVEVVLVDTGGAGLDDELLTGFINVDS